MKTLIRQFILFICAISLFGCSNTAINDVQEKEYAYLAPFVKRGAQWTNVEWLIFMRNLNNKHLAELALEWEVLTETSPGVNVYWGENKQKVLSIGTNQELALDRLGGRKEAIKSMRDRFIKASTYFGPIFTNEVEWHKTVKWACDESGVASKNSENKSSFDAERVLIGRLFEKSWDKLNAKQRKDVIERSKLTELNAQQKVAMIAGTGASALLMLNTTVAMYGFAFYTTMSSVIAATASVIGVTIPFSVYTGASMATGALTGPVGWLALAAATVGMSLYALSPDEVKVTKMIVSLHVLKAKALEDAGMIDAKATR